MSHSTSAIHGGSDIVSDLLSDTVTIEAAMTQRRLAAQVIERMRKDEANAVEYRRVLADEIDRLSAENATLKAERDSFCMDYRMRCDVETKTLHAEIERLQARVAELERDATRYRWIANMCEVSCMGAPIESDSDVDAMLGLLDAAMEVKP